jgi:hypothetical protein
MTSMQRRPLLLAIGKSTKDIILPLPQGFLLSKLAGRFSQSYLVISPQMSFNHVNTRTQLDLQHLRNCEC